MGGLMITASDFLKWLNIFNVPSGNAPTGPVTKQEVQQSAFNYSVATGADDAFVVILDPAVVNLTDGLLISLSSAYTNLTTTPTIQVNSLSPVPITLADNADLAPGDIQPDNSYLLEYNFANSAFQLLNPTYSTANTFSTQENAYNFAIDSGSVNELAVELLPAPQNITAGAFPVFVQLANTNTDAVTISINSSSTIPVLSMQGNPLIGGEMVLNYISYLLYNPEQSAFILQNSALASGVTPTQVQQAAFNTGTDSGAADAYIVDLSPAVTSLTNGLMVSFTAANYNLTSSPTLQINALTPVPILGINGGVILAGDLNESVISYLIYAANTAAFVLLNPFNSIALTGLVQINAYNTGFDSGVADAYVVTTTPGASPYMSLSNGMQISFTPLNNNITTTPTLTLNGLATVNIALSNGAVAAGDLSTNMTATVVYSSAAGQFILITPANSYSGTWTPVVTFATPGDLSVSYNTQIGSYNRCGNQVTINFSLVFTPTYTTASGFLVITGLPFVSDTSSFGSCMLFTVTYPAGCTAPVLEIVDGTSDIALLGLGSAAIAQFSSTQFPTGIQYEYQGTVTYLT